jgi:choline dehydrogenase
MSLGASQVAVFAKSKEDLDTPDIQFHFQPLSADKPGLIMHSFSGFTSSVCQLRPQSRGSVHISSPHVVDHPKICPRYLTAIADQLCVIRAIKFARKIGNCSALKPFIIRNHSFGEEIKSDKDYLEVARSESQTIYHPTSTCRMGSDKRSVVNSKLQVHGIKNLRVADASIMPNIVSGNTNAPTIMIGEKASELILKSRL